MNRSFGEGARWLDAFDGIDWGLAVSEGQSGVLSSTNAAFARMHGYSREELLGRPISDLVAPEDLPVFADAIRRAEQDGHCVYERTAVRKDGTRFAAQVALSMVKSPAGAILFRAVHVVDVSRRRESNRALELTRFAMDTAADATYWFDETGTVVYANHAACRSLGYEHDEFLGLPIRAFVPRYEHASWPETLARTKAAGTLRFESIHRRKDGSTFFVEVSANYLEQDGRAFLCGFARDVTERKRTHDELNESRARLELLSHISKGVRAGTAVDEILLHAVEEIARRFPALRVAYSTVDDEGALSIHHSRQPPGMQTIGGMAVSIAQAPAYLAALRRQETVVVGDASADARVAPLAAALAEGNTRSLLEVPLSHDDALVGLLSFDSPDVRTWTEHEIKALEEVAGYLSIAIKEARTNDERHRALIELEAANVQLTQEIAERKRVENEMRELNQTLESRVADRTDELRAANRELEAFVYSVSHDLRAPVRSMGSFSRIVLDEHGATLGERGRSDLERIGRAARRMERMIEDMLNLSRVSKRRLDPEVVNLTELAGSVLDELRAAAPERRVTATIAPDLCAHGDPGMLRILLHNLLGNSWKFTRDEAEARIDFLLEDRGAEEVFVVRDNGAGFEMEYAHKLFLPFQRLHSTEQFEGTGVGLATVERIVRRHRGRIWARSEPGQGAGFFFTLGPLPPGPEGVDGAASRTEPQ